jgi:hypothetical protein
MDLMSLFLKILATALFVVGGYLLILNNLKYIFMYEKISDHLFFLGDTDSLKKIGRMNKLGKRTYLFVGFLQVHEVLLKKFDETKDDYYWELDEEYMKNVKLEAILVVILFALYAFCVIMKS